MLDQNTAKRFKDALFRQQYNLLTGAGASLDSLTRGSKPLLGAEALRKRLCSVTGVREDSPLWRVAGYLTAQQIQDELTVPYLGCKAGHTARQVTRLIWRSIYTLNIDDSLENAFEQNVSRVQSSLSVNFVDEFRMFRNPKEVPIVHIHGHSRKPQDGYVFSIQEYAGVQTKINPWIHCLSSLIVSEPFIITGTSLFEPDLEYFFAHRPSKSDVLARAPSLLIEPFPDSGTKRDCERLGLVLVEAKLSDFIDWVVSTFGPIPSPATLNAPAIMPRVTSQVPQSTAAAFWSDFHFVCPKKLPDSTPADQTPRLTEPSPFLYGRQPSWEDLDARLDVPIRSQLRLVDECKKWLGTSQTKSILCYAGLAGAGKSTAIKRAALDLMEFGIQVFYINARDGIDIDSATDFFATAAGPLVIATDTLAEHSDEIVAILRRLPPDRRVFVLGAERQYRIRFVREALDEFDLLVVELEHWRVEELEVLVERYIGRGLTGTSEPVQDIRRFAREATTATIAETVCRVLNNFRPLRVIARSLWNDAHTAARPAYLAAAIANYLHPVGIRKNILAASFSASLLEDLEHAEVPLRLCAHADDSEFLVPVSTTLSTLLVEELARENPDRLLAGLVDLSNAIAPFVSRFAIKQRTAEAKLAARLFDADGKLYDLLHERTDKFFDATYERWKWNSRYWEQRALLIIDRDRRTALQHARHAVSIERHPYSMTVLARVLFAMASDDANANRLSYSEGLDLMKETLSIEAHWERGHTKKAFWVIFDGVSRFLNAGGTHTQRQLEFLRRSIEEVARGYSQQSDIAVKAADLAKNLGNPLENESARA